jgi:hypothetical protein
MGLVKCGKEGCICTIQCLNNGVSIDSLTFHIVHESSRFWKFIEVAYVQQAMWGYTEHIVPQW